MRVSLGSQATGELSDEEGAETVREPGKRMAESVLDRSRSGSDAATSHTVRRACHSAFRREPPTTQLDRKRLKSPKGTHERRMVTRPARRREEARVPEKLAVRGSEQRDGET